MYIEELDLPHILDVANTNSVYNSDEWFLYALHRLPNYIRLRQRRRDLFPWIEDDEHPNDRAQEEISVLLELNKYKYDHLWKLYTADYNPIWNVDGSEKLTIHREEVGTRDSSDAKSGYDTLNYNGKESISKEGSIAEIHGGNVQQQRTTFDSTTDYNTDKVIDSTTKTNRYGKQADGTTDAYKETKEFTTRNDKTDYNSTNTIDEDTTGKLDETQIKERGGNIGVTMTQQLEEAELEWIKKFNFLDILLNDVCNCISYHTFN